MLRIRLLRVGKKNRPSFRLVVTPKRSAPQTGRFLEVLGFYDPIKHAKEFKKDRIKYWMSCGASVSDTVRNMLVSEGIIEGEKVAVHRKPRPKADQPSAEKEEEKTTDVEKKAAPSS